MAAHWNKTHRIGNFTFDTFLDGKHRGGAGRCPAVKHRIGHVTGGVH